MEIYADELRNKWDAINYYSGGSLQLDIKHPLEWHVRYATLEQKSLVVVVHQMIDSIASSKSIEATCNLRKDGKYALSFVLLDKKQEDVFITMASDIIQFSQGDSSETALSKIVKRYAAWLKLLDHKKSALLSGNEQKGLVGELSYLKERLILGMQPREAIEGWVGPDGADQDFVYSDGWHEIKSTGKSSAEISISSVEQLDNELAGELLVYRIDKCAPAFSGATTLYKMVHSILDILQQDIDLSDTFLLKLASGGYIDMQDYDVLHYVVFDTQRFWVDETFPSIKRKTIPVEIVNVEYRLSISSLTKWSK